MNGRHLKISRLTISSKLMTVVIAAIVLMLGVIARSQVAPSTAPPATTSAPAAAPASAPTSGPGKPPSVQEFCDDVVEKMKNLQHPPFRDVTPLIDGSDAFNDLSNRLLLTLHRYDPADCIKFDDAHVAAGFGKAALPEAKQDQDIFKKLPTDWNAEYLTYPFFVEPRNVDPNALQAKPAITIWVTSTLTSAPLSDRAFYLFMFRGLRNFPTNMDTHPTLWTYAISSLAATAVTAPGPVAKTTDLDIETALVALICWKEPSLLNDLTSLGDPLNPGPRRIDVSSGVNSEYGQKLARAIGSIGSRNPQGVAKSLLSAPESQWISQPLDKAKNKDKAANGADQSVVLSPIHPSWRITLEALPDDESSLKALMNDIRTKFKHPVLRAVLLNACFDKLCVIWARGMSSLGDSTVLLRHMLAHGSNSDAVRKQFEEQRAAMWSDMRVHLESRATPPNDSGEATVAYDPALAKWVFRFLYNTSMAVREQEEKARKEWGIPPADQSTLADDKTFAQHIDEKTILDWCRSDPTIAEFFKAVGTPIVHVHNSEATLVGKELEFVWQLRRTETNDQEMIRLRLFDPFSSGGGKPLPGVGEEAQVIVRKELAADPVKVSLGTVQEGWYLRTMSTLQPSSDPKNPTTEDWARVKEIGVKGTRGAYQIESDGRGSGSDKALAVGGLQDLWTMAPGETKWSWRQPKDIGPGVHSLLKINPEDAPSPTSVFLPVKVDKCDVGDKGTQLVTIKLSYGEPGVIKDTGADVWGYFADGRFVQALVYPADAGVDGNAELEIPAGTKKLQDAKGEPAEPPQHPMGDIVHGFVFGEPSAFQDRVVGNLGGATDFQIQIKYQVPGKPNAQTLCVAEGQKLLTVDERGVSLKKAYQLTMKSNLVAGFDAQGRPIAVPIQDLHGVKKSLNVFKLAMAQCPLARINGILVPVANQSSPVCSGIEAQTKITLAPNQIEIQRANQNPLQGLKLPNPATVMAASVKATPSSTRAANATQTNPNEATKSQETSLLCYSALVQPHAFWESGVEDVKPEAIRRYIVIKIHDAELTCGHQQEIYVVSPETPDLLQVRYAADIYQQVRSGTTVRVAWLNATNPSAAKVEIVPVESAREMFVAEDVTMEDIVVKDSPAVRSGLRPDGFANGILVHFRVKPPDASGDEPGATGTRSGRSEYPREPRESFPQPFMTKAEPTLTPLRNVKYEDDDLSAFDANLKSLNESFSKKGDLKNWDKVPLLLTHYFDRQVGQDEVQRNLKAYFDQYVQFRQFLIQTGDSRGLPEVVSSYLLVATLLYGGEATEAGDALTRDFLCIALRTVDKESVGKEFFVRDATQLRLGLQVARDLLLYARPTGPGERNQADGLGPMSKVTFPDGTMDKPLELLLKEGINADAWSGGKINLYNLCAQLDEHFGNSSALMESILAPGMSASKLFQGKAMDALKLAPEGK